MRAELTRTLAPPHRRYRPLPRPTGRRAGLYPDEPETCRRSLRLFWPVLAHLALLWGVFRVYRIEGRAFQLLVTVALAALPIHYALPYRFKKPFFVAASIVGLAWVFGPATAAIVLAVGGVLIGVCYLPLRWGSRASLVAAIGLTAGVLRTQWSTSPVLEGAWAVLGSMFMFRMILYLYELKHAERPEPLIDTVGYFLLLPNFGFLHFPVLDYRAYRRGYFAGEVHAVQRTGLRMMTRGLFHLLAYRLVEHHALIEAGEVHDGWTLAVFLASNYLLYLRVSGQFHMACGMLHLFGFQLPETHRNYLLASSFTDYWRRINIYWKDFMVRVVFNPVALRLRRRPQWQALAAATAAVFVTTWALHAYQSFWLRGTWALSAPDALFWTVLGVLVLVNVQVDARSCRRPPDPSWPGRLIHSAKVAATFVTIAVLWSLWSSPSLGAWLEMLGRAIG